MLPLGSELPSFELDLVPGTKIGKNFSLNGKAKLNNKMISDKPLLLMVICAHCPFVKHIEAGISSLNEDYKEYIQFIAVSSNSLETHPQDGPHHLAQQSNDLNWDFPYLIDLEQSFAKSIKAACTPDFFLFAEAKSPQNTHKLVYRGQLDDSRPGNSVLVTGKDIREAFNALLRGGKVPTDQKPSIGCNIKWHPGNEPNWFG